jgi:hypothetical protein
MASDEGRGGREIGSLLDNPRDRRWWLLTKALEGEPLRAALTTALAADVFIVEGADGLSPERHPIEASGDADRPTEDEALAEIASAAVESRYRH